MKSPTGLADRETDRQTDKKRGNGSDYSKRKKGRAKTQQGGKEQYSESHEERKGLRSFIDLKR